jgi:hypothetical protein
VQFEFAGALPVADGRYLARGPGEDAAQSVLVIETLGAPSSPGRRRRRPVEADPDGALPTLPLGRATAVRAFEPFGSAEEAARWLQQTLAEEETVDAVVTEAIALLNRALFAHSVASADPYGGEQSARRATRVKVGFGSGDEVASGRFTAASEVDVRSPGGSRRRRREEEMRPQERVAAVLVRRERLDACEPLLLRARADLDAERYREAALQLRIGLDALLVELAGALVDPGHEEDMRTLIERHDAAVAAANAALHGALSPESERTVRELLELCERILRRRRILRG